MRYAKRGVNKLGDGAWRRSGVLVLVVALSLGLLAGCSKGATSPTAVGTWKLTYGAPAVVKIESTGSNSYSMTATTPVFVTGGSKLCHLAIGTTLATFTGRGSSYDGRHGLWSTTNCSFAEWTTLRLTVKGDTAIALLGNGESHTLTRVPTADNRNKVWLWVLLVLLIAAATLAYLVFHRRRRSVGSS